MAKEKFENPFMIGEEILVSKQEFVNTIRDPTTGRMIKGLKTYLNDTFGCGRLYRDKRNRDVIMNLSPKAAKVLTIIMFRQVADKMNFNVKELKSFIKDKDINVGTMLISGLKELIEVGLVGVEKYKLSKEFDWENCMLWTNPKVVYFKERKNDFPNKIYETQKQRESRERANKEEREAEI